MTQTDKLIKAVIVIVALICVGLVTDKNLIQVTECNRVIAQCDRSIERSQKSLRTSKSYLNSSCLKGEIEGTRAKKDRYTKTRAKSMAFLIFGNIGIIAVAIGLNAFLISKKEE